MQDRCADSCMCARMRVLSFLLLQLDKVVAVFQNAARWAGYVVALKGALSSVGLSCDGCVLNTFERCT